ncbi:hypothetical protein J4E91_008490 [Alternaria rosae]|nr:hypothetical protein J4E91_008490 [Alternaria rosae]
MDKDKDHRTMTVSQAVSDGITFTGLETDKCYFPVVFRDVEGAFFSELLGSVAPLTHDVVVPCTPKANATPMLSSVESDSRPITTDTIDPHDNSQIPQVNEEDEMEDNAYLYQYPSRSASASVPSGTPPPPAPLRPRQRQERSNVVTVDLTKRPKNDTYVPGTKVEHKSLDWGGSFPGSHDFYRTRGEPDQEIYILKPKTGTMKPRNKRMRSGATERGSAKKPRTGTAASRAGSYIDLLSAEPEEYSESVSRRSPFLRRGQSARNLRPDAGVDYRKGRQ